MYMYDCVQKKVGMRRGTIETIEKRPVEKYISLYVEKMKVREIASFFKMYGFTQTNLGSNHGSAHPHITSFE